MTLTLPFEPLYILYRLQMAGYEAYLVGGAVRDLLIPGRDKSVKDYDFASNATPEQIQAVFPQSFYENKFGTVSITIEDLLSELASKQLPNTNLLSTFEAQHNNKQQSQRIIDLSQAKKIHVSLQENKKNEERIDKQVKIFPPFEITTYRSEDVYDDHRRPNIVSWGKNISEDLQRRDFTINALAIVVQPNFLQTTFTQAALEETYNLSADDFTLIDNHQGLTDLNNKIIRTVGNPNRRFNEDALRMIRAIRLAVELEMEIETDTLQAIKDNQHLSKFISMERIRDEFLRILSVKNADHGIRLLDETNLLQYIIPELLEAKNIKQGGHHSTDVWVHSLDSLANCPSGDPIVKLAALLHDIGKPQTYEDKGEDITFYNHEIIGSRLASQIAKRLRLSKKDVQRVFILVRYHMFHYQPWQSDAAIRRFMRKVGLENIDDILDLREGDRLGSGAKKTSWRLEEMKERIIAQLNQPMDENDLAVDGHDLMRELQLKPGPILGEILQHLLDLTLEEPELNHKEQLLAAARRYLQEQSKI